MFSMCSELTPRAPILDTRIAQLMQPCCLASIIYHEAARTFPVHVHFFCIDNDDNFQLEWCSNIKIFRVMVVVGLTPTFYFE